ncbi:hypothetical protein O0235_10600 [Tepidiforma flava]|uniref:Pr1-like protein n=1 Tax=Tepidiforma flava TaxID=3004094 RepID=A0ABY7M4E6_9CHLR|nr:hypothetical protein [Tepidiforma flava]WBL35235.1 hypothetical protein O0235_10600 [Tepidiforma flava]
MRTRKSARTVGEGGAVGVGLGDEDDDGGAGKEADGMDGERVEARAGREHADGEAGDGRWG